MIIEFLALLKEFISEVGYLGICFLMILESMIFPIPSEGVMPFAGYLINNKFSWMGVFVSSSLGSIIGSYLSYLLGQYGGLPFLRHYGKYFLITQSKLNTSIEFFQKYGDKAIFISRFIPVIRHFISIPAGIAHMSIYKFFIYTFFGASLWNMFLAYIGYICQGDMSKIHHYKHILDIIGISVLLIFIIILAIYNWRKNARKSHIS